MGDGAKCRSKTTAAPRRSNATNCGGNRPMSPPVPGSDPTEKRPRRSNATTQWRMRLRQHDAAQHRKWLQKSPHRSNSVTRWGKGLWRHSVARRRKQLQKAHTPASPAKLPDKNVSRAITVARWNGRTRKAIAGAATGLAKGFKGRKFFWQVRKEVRHQ